MRSHLGLSVFQEGGTSTSTLSGDDEAGSAEETATPVKVTTPRQKAAAARKVKTETEEAVSVPKKGSSAKVIVRCA